MKTPTYTIDDCTETLTITYKGHGIEQSVSYKANPIVIDDVFWEWFITVFDTVGFPTITSNIKGEE